jgi:aminoglycoside phosphotransferase (APT) family kinase protein
VSDLSQAARDLGAFLAALRRIDAAGGPPAGRANSGRGVPLALLDKRVRDDVAALGDEVDGPAILRIWDQALAAPVHDGPLAWVHGDLHPSNLVVRDGRIVGVLDFGLLGVGDPACDLFLAWSFLDAPGREVFREVSQVDEAAWLRGRGWGIFSAIIALAFYLRTNPTLCAMSRRTLAEVLL